jgi:hypothetical protein
MFAERTFAGRTFAERTVAEDVRREDVRSLAGGGRIINASTPTLYT